MRCSLSSCKYRFRHPKSPDAYPSHSSEFPSPFSPIHRAPLVDFLSRYSFPIGRHLNSFSCGQGTHLGCGLSLVSLVRLFYLGRDGLISSLDVSSIFTRHRCFYFSFCDFSIRIGYPVNLASDPLVWYASDLVVCCWRSCFYTWRQALL